MAKKDEFSAMFDPAKKAAAAEGAKRLRAAGFCVFSSGWGAVTVKHGGRVIIVPAEEVDQFIKENSNG